MRLARANISSAASASTDQSRLSSRSRGRPGDDLTVDRREDEHTLAERRGHGQEDLVEGLALRRREDEELSLARIYAHGVISGQARHLVREQARAIDCRCGAHPLSVGELEQESVARRLREPGDSCGQSHLRTAGLRGVCQRVHEGDRIRDRLSGHVQRAVFIQARLDTIGMRVLGQSRDGSLLVVAVRLQPSAAAPHSDAELPQQLVAQLRRAQDQPGLELARSGVKAGVQDARVRAARSEGQRRLGLEQYDPHAAASQRMQDRTSDDAAADDGDLCVDLGHQRRRLRSAATGAA
jgi:hypothetical protein